jgi:hypothetical protein
MTNVKIENLGAPNQLNSLKRVEQTLNVGHTKVCEEIRGGNLEARKIGRRTVVTNEALERYIASLPIVGARQ